MPHSTDSKSKGCGTGCSDSHGKSSGGKSEHQSTMSANGANLSFAGCGFLGIYHVGAATCFKQYAPQLLDGKIAGASAGALVACTLICGCCMGDCTTFTLKLALEARSRILGPLSPRFRLVKYLREAMNGFLPDNAHEICSGKLHVSMTRISDRENVLVSQYPTKADLIDALICSSFVPLYSGFFPPSFAGVRYIDGAVSDNIPILDDKTITISPFAGESDICPDDNSCNFHHFSLGGTSVQITGLNLLRMSVAFMPPAPEILSNMCRQGFEDALRYMRKSKMISCAQHLSFCSNIISSSPVNYDLVETYTSSQTVNQENVTRAIRKRFGLKTSDSQSESSGAESDDEDSECDVDKSTSCEECEERTRTSMGDVPPLKVERALQAACDEENKALLAPLYRNTAYKVASMMAVPYLFPLEVAINLVRKLYEWSPYMSEDMQWFFKELYRLLTELIQSVQENKSMNIWEQLSLKFYLGWNLFPGCHGKRSPKKSTSVFPFPFAGSSIPSPLSTPTEGQLCRRHSLRSPTGSKTHRRHKTSVVTYEGPVDLDAEVVEDGVHKEDENQSVDVNFGISLNYSVTDSPLKCVSNVRRQLLEEGRASALGASRASSTWSLASVDTLASGTPRENSELSAAVNYSADAADQEFTDDMVPMNTGDYTGGCEGGAITPTSVGAVDSSFDEVLYVADQMDSILSYYYTEESDPTKVKVVEIFPLQQRHQHHHHHHSSGGATSGSQAASVQSSPSRTRKKSRKISHVLLHK